MTSVCLCLVTIFVMLIEIKALRRINDYGSFQSVISSEGRPILRGGMNELQGIMGAALRPALRVGLDELILEKAGTALQPALRGGLDDLLEKVDVDINVRLQPKGKRKRTNPPMQTNENPAKKHKEAYQMAMPTDENQVKTYQNPVKKHREAYQMAMPTDEDQVQTYQNPVKKHREAYQMAMPTDVGQVKTNEDPVETYGNPVKTNENPVETDENPVQTYENPVKNHREAYQMAIPNDEEQVKTDENPVKTYRKPGKTYEKPGKKHNEAYQMAIPTDEQQAKNDQESYQMALPLPLRDDENPPKESEKHLRKRHKPNSEESDDDSFPVMRTVMPDSSPEKKDSVETEEALTFLQSGDTKNDDSSGEETISLLREDEDNDEDPSNYERQKYNKPVTLPEWAKDLKKYIRILSSKYPRDAMLSHLRPVIKVLERNHQVKIKDIDVDKRGQVKVIIKNGSKRL
ncbi:uncharacterized protein LOC125238403 isoform X13 [Leguminivora glycinivorella]|uniref:uncharacterized protein LOC125238403 isoform X13 n=1 Tax=Leguminivora glycinivorella TaxID=1035111 RepID=UPI00200C7764|nr:uncharacterized protein LOC125238403 isoform X13 [Leguminivora glycinivorella]